MNPLFQDWTGCSPFELRVAQMTSSGCLQEYAADIKNILTAIGVMSILSGMLKMAGAVCGCVMAGEILNERAREEERAGLIRSQE